MPAWIDIAFCVGCNYQPRAASLAATLREAYPEAVVTLTPTGGGKFEVSADHALVFSKETLELVHDVPVFPPVSNYHFVNGWVVGGL